ncbi:MAG: hypothetical protein QOG42_417 [Solirubrobacteraceae bacterium]|jgi:hypothetical protein|nr:hypothetical protein [Solirubrobacteraceae bacterium]
MNRDGHLRRLAGRINAVAHDAAATEARALALRLEFYDQF